MTRSSQCRLSILVAGVLMVTACSASPVTGPDATSPVVGSATASATAQASSSAAGPGATPSAPSVGPGETAFDQVIAMLGPDGTATPEIALEAFALAVAPLPGVTVRQGPNEWPDADAAVAWVAHVWDQLDPAQQKAIGQALNDLPDPYSEAGQSPVADPAVTLAAFRPMTAAADRNCGLSASGENDINDSAAATTYL